MIYVPGTKHAVARGDVMGMVAVWIASAITLEASV